MRQAADQEAVRTLNPEMGDGENGAASTSAGTGGGDGEGEEADAHMQTQYGLENEDGVESGSYQIPDPYADLNQRSLCNKCHNKDVNDANPF